MDNDYMGPLVRSYIAIRIPESIWPKIQETQNLIRRKSASDACRWSGQNETILILCALGEQQWEMVKRASTVLGPICAKYPPLNLNLEGIQGIPNNNQPRYATLNVTGDLDNLKRLREEIARAVAPLLAPTEKEFSPHIVLGRLKMESEPARTGLGRAIRMIPSEVIATWQAPIIELVRTEATSNGVQYLTVEQFGLTAAAPV